MQDSDQACKDVIPAAEFGADYAVSCSDICANPHPLGAKASADISPDRIEEIEQLMRDGAVDLYDLPVRNFFSKGVYARELFIPKGTILTGKIHKFSNLNIMAKGELSVLVDGAIERVSAPFVVVSPPGTKRIAYAHEDTVWITVHGTDETDLEKIESQFTADSYLDFLAFCEQAKIEGD